MTTALVQRVQKLIAGRFHRKPALRPPGNAMVSVTFDDFPRSAWTLGGSILGEYGARGTYYVSLGLMGRITSVGEIFERGDLERLVAAGHELACHTHDHALCCDLNGAELLDNCEQNQRRMADLLNGYQPRAFSFPEGVVTLSAKTLLNSVYASCRTIEPGINGNSIDLGFLRANAIYSKSNFHKWQEIIRINAEKKGWLILYTHDISARPSRWGCTPEQFRAVLTCVAKSGAEILSVTEAANRFIPICPSA
jgi:peptidoglycan/xylan/chitin deacetylase (PgdA/CDA1 family)